MWRRGAGAKFLRDAADARGDEDDPDALYQLFERLLRRRTMAAERIRTAWKSTAQPFPL